MTLSATPKSFTYRKYSATMKRLKIVPPPLTKVEQARSWDQALYKTEKERCYARLAQKVNSIEDYLNYYAESIELERYEISQAVTEVLRDHHKVNTSNTHKYLHI